MQNVTVSFGITFKQKQIRKEESLEIRAHILLCLCKIDLKPTRSRSFYDGACHKVTNHWLGKVPANRRFCRTLSNELKNCSGVSTAFRNHSSSDLRSFSAHVIWSRANYRDICIEAQPFCCFYLMTSTSCHHHNQQKQRSKHNPFEVASFEDAALQ